MLYPSCPSVNPVAAHASLSMAEAPTYCAAAATVSRGGRRTGNLHMTGMRSSISITSQMALQASSELPSVERRPIAARCMGGCPSSIMRMSPARMPPCASGYRQAAMTGMG